METTFPDADESGTTTHPEGGTGMIRVHRSGPRHAAATALRYAKIAVATTIIVLGAIDGGSCVLARLSVTDQVKEAGMAAAQAAENQPLTTRTAERAYNAAQSIAATSNATVVADGPQGFALERDGSVTLTLTRTAPTLLLHRIGALAHYAHVEATWTQRPAHY